MTVPGAEIAALLSASVGDGLIATARLLREYTDRVREHRGGAWHRKGWFIYTTTGQQVATGYQFEAAGDYLVLFAHPTVAYAAAELLEAYGKDAQGPQGAASAPPFYVEQLARAILAGLSGIGEGAA